VNRPTTWVPWVNSRPVGVMSTEIVRAPSNGLAVHRREPRAKKQGSWSTVKQRFASGATASSASGLGTRAECSTRPRDRSE
jgi:hypothetical protein